MVDRVGRIECRNSNRRRGGWLWYSLGMISASVTLGELSQALQCNMRYVFKSRPLLILLQILPLAADIEAGRDLPQGRTQIKFTYCSVLVTPTMES